MWSGLSLPESQKHHLLGTEVFPKEPHIHLAGKPENAVRLTLINWTQTLESDWFWTLDPKLSYCLTLDKLLNITVPISSTENEGANSIHLIAFF